MDVVGGLKEQETTNSEENTEKKKQKKFKRRLTKEDIGVIGSYSSFLALLLIATVLAFRHIFNYVINLYFTGASSTLLTVVFTSLIVAVGVAFIVIPSLPLLLSIRRAFRVKNHWLAWVLIFICLVYIFAIISQFVYTLLNKLID